MTAFGMKLETSRFLDAEMAFAIKEARYIEFTEPDQIEWVRRHMARAYDKARQMEQSTNHGD